MDIEKEDLLGTFNENGIDAECKSYLVEIGKWTRFIAITLFVVTGLFLVIFLYNIQGLSYYGNRFAGLALGMLFASILIGVIFYFLLNFGTKIRRGAEGEDIQLINQGLASFKVHLILVGIFSVFYALLNLYKLLL